MQTFRKILCAVDLSEMSAKVAEYATTLARAFDAEVLVVYVAPSPTHFGSLGSQTKAVDSFVEEVAQSAVDQMRKVMDASFSGVRAESRVLTGFPAEEILEEAGRWGADLVVMGTHGRKGVNLLLFGSVAEKVVKGAGMPVLTVNPDR